MAVAESDGTAELHVNAFKAASSLLPLNVELQERANNAYPESASLDILKVDIQGGEVKTLHGAAELLKARRIGLIYTEVLFVPLYQGQGWFYDIAAYLEGYGYRLFDFYSFLYGEDGQLKWGDAVFLPVK